MLVQQARMLRKLPQRRGLQSGGVLTAANAHEVARDKEKDDVHFPA